MREARKNRMCEKTISRGMQDLHDEWTFIVSCQKTPGTLHIVIQKNNREAAEITRADSCAIASLQRFHESRWQLQTGAEGRNVRPRRRETSITQTREQDNCTKVTKKEIKPSLIPWTTWQNNVKTTVDNTWQISPLCHLL